MLACVAATNAYYYGPVIEVAKPHSPVGSHGPALVNLFSHNSWGGYSGYGGLGGYGGGGKQITIKLKNFAHQSHSGYFIGI